MEKNDLTRSHLETLSSADLIDLADDYGIDIPENLTRHFVIVEILDTLAEYTQKKEPEIRESKNEVKLLELPSSYNENRIIAVLRNPVWCYVYWDFKEEDYNSIFELPSFSSFVIRVLYYGENDPGEILQTFDIQVTNTDREQFILLSSQMFAFRVELIACFKSGEHQFLASSVLTFLPKGCLKISLSSLRQDFSPIQKLSGLPELLRLQYAEHRQSFL